jgi:hypothetical protein
LIYNPSSKMLATSRGTFKRFVTYVEGGCPDSDGAFSNMEDTRPAKTVPQTPSASATAFGTRQIVLGDANSKSIWSTSQYSYTGRGGGPGGGLADDRLRVGGWGDRYVALLRFDLPDQRVVRKAMLVLTVKGDDPASQPTPMTVRIANGPWGWVPGDRLWWKDLPPSEISFQTGKSGAPGSIYAIDITQIYNSWAKGVRANNGILLEPVLTNNNFSTFYSTRALASNRPRLALSY